MHDISVAERQFFLICFPRKCFWLHLMTATTSPLGRIAPNTRGPRYRHAWNPFSFRDWFVMPSSLEGHVFGHYHFLPGGATTLSLGCQIILLELPCSEDDHRNMYPFISNYCEKRSHFTMLKEVAGGFCLFESKKKNKCLCCMHGNNIWLEHSW